MPTPAAPQTNKLVAYNPQAAPTVSGLDLFYIQKELTALRTSMRSVQTIMRQLEARIAALGG